jgi:DNA-binding GntR family transcriptional regulator
MGNDSEGRLAIPAIIGFTNEPLRLRIAAIIREAILNGDLEPGRPLTELEIAEQFDVSRAPVREAMRILANEGLIETEPYRGSRVKVITRRDVEEVYSLRRVHESFAVERIVHKCSANDLRTLSEICKRMREHAERRDMQAVSLEDELFHRTLIELADHQLLLTIWNELSLRVRQTMSLRNLQIEVPERLAENHLAIVDALADRDLKRALALVDAHVSEGGQLVIDCWNEEA